MTTTTTTTDGHRPITTEGAARMYLNLATAEVALHERVYRAAVDALRREAHALAVLLQEGQHKPFPSQAVSKADQVRDAWAQLERAREQQTMLAEIVNGGAA